MGNICSTRVSNHLEVKSLFIEHQVELKSYNKLMQELFEIFRNPISIRREARFNILDEKLNNIIKNIERIKDKLLSLGNKAHIKMPRH